MLKCFGHSSTRLILHVQYVSTNARRAGRVKNAQVTYLSPSVSADVANSSCCPEASRGGNRETPCTLNVPRHGLACALRDESEDKGSKGVGSRKTIVAAGQ